MEWTGADSGTGTDPGADSGPGSGSGANSDPGSGADSRTDSGTDAFTASSDSLVRQRFGQPDSGCWITAAHTHACSGAYPGSGPSATDTRSGARPRAGSADFASTHCGASVTQC